MIDYSVTPCWAGVWCKSGHGNCAPPHSFRSVSPAMLCGSLSFARSSYAQNGRAQVSVSVPSSLSADCGWGANRMKEHLSVQRALCSFCLRKEDEERREKKS